MNAILFVSILILLVVFVRALRRQAISPEAQAEAAPLRELATEPEQPKRRPGRPRKTV